MFTDDEFLVGDIYKNEQGEVLFITNKIGNNNIDGIMLDGRTFSMMEKEELVGFKLYDRTGSFRWWSMYDYYARKCDEKNDNRQKLIKNLGGPSIVAEKVGVSRATVNYWIHGAKMSIPHRKKLFTFAGAMGVSLETWDD